MGLISTKSFEDNLADALERLLSQEAATIDAFVEGLNAMNVRGPRGQVWTGDLLEQELARLGA